MRPLGIATSLVALGCALTASAQANRNVSLNWVRAPEADGCTSAKNVAQRVQSYFESEHLLSQERFQFVSSASAHVAIEALVTPYQDGWQVAIGMSRGAVRVTGTEFVQRSRSCDDLEVQAALVISQLLEAPGLFHEPQAEEAVAAPMTVAYVVDTELGPTSSAPKPPGPSRARIAPREDDGTQLRLMTGGVIERGALPSTGLGVRVGAGLEARGLFPIELHTAFIASDGAGQFPDGQEGITARASVVFRGAKLALLACPASWRAGRFGVFGCAGLGGSATNAALRGFRRNEAAWVSWLGIEVAVRPAFQLSTSFAIWLEGAASLTALQSADFVADVSDATSEQVTLYEAPSQTAQLALGISYLL